MERIVKIDSAYDNRSEGRGIKSCFMYMVLKGEEGAVVLSISTGWYLDITDQWKEECVQKNGINTWKASPMGVSYCSPVPLHEWQADNGRPDCDWLGCTCYGDTGYTMADEPFQLLLTKGSDAVWEWLENYYKKTFNPPPQQS